MSFQFFGFVNLKTMGDSIPSAFKFHVVLFVFGVHISNSFKTEYYLRGGKITE